MTEIDYDGSAYDMSDWEASIKTSQTDPRIDEEFIPGAIITFDVSKLSWWKSARAVKAISDLRKVDGIRVTKKKARTPKNDKKKKLRKQPRPN